MLNPHWEIAIFYLNFKQPANLPPSQYPGTCCYPVQMPETGPAPPDRF